MHQLKEVDMLSAKMDLLMKMLKDRANEKQEVMHIHDSHMMGEEYGNTRHLGSNCPETHEDVNFVNNYSSSIESRMESATETELPR